MSIYVSRHALSRFREHHPQGTSEEVLRYLSEGESISQDLAQTLTGRHKGSVSTDDYVVSPDGQGLFVVHDSCVITYLRFQQSQTDFVIAQGMAHAPEAVVEEVEEGVYEELEPSWSLPRLGRISISDDLAAFLECSKSHLRRRVVPLMTHHETIPHPQTDRPRMLLEDSEGRRYHLDQTLNGWSLALVAP